MSALKSVRFQLRILSRHFLRFMSSGLRARLKGVNLSLGTTWERPTQRSTMATRPTPHLQVHHFPANYVPAQTIAVLNIPQLSPLHRNSKLRWPKRIATSTLYRVSASVLSVLSLVIFIVLTVRNSKAFRPVPESHRSFVHQSFKNSSAIPPLKIAYPFQLYDQDQNHGVNVNRNETTKDQQSIATSRQQDGRIVTTEYGPSKYKHEKPKQEAESVVKAEIRVKKTVRERLHGHDDDTRKTEQDRKASKAGSPKFGVDLDSVRGDFRKVITEFMETAPLSSFNRTAIFEHYRLDQNNMKKTAMLVTIKNGKANFTHAFRPSQHGRAESVQYIIEKIIEDRSKNGQLKLPDVTFLVMVSDGHGAKVATFGSARHWKHWINLIPVPMGNRRGMGLGWGTLLNGWDKYVDSVVTGTHANYSWDQKIEKAFFRGVLSMQTYRLGTCNFENGHMCVTAQNWRQVNRGVLWLRAQDEPSLFDVGFTSVKKKPNSPVDAMAGAPQPVDSIRFVDYQKFKYIINVGNNQDWAERLRNLLFTNSAVVLHEAETQEFFMPLLKPWVHYIPTNLMMTDLVDHVKWAKANDHKVRQIVRQQHAFAHRYLSEQAMQAYWEISINEFAKRQSRASEQTKNGLKKADEIVHKKATKATASS